MRVPLGQLLVAALGAGCAETVGEHHLSAREQYQQQSSNALFTATPSDTSLAALRRCNLVESFDAVPAVDR